MKWKCTLIVLLPSPIQVNGKLKMTDSKLVFKGNKSGSKNEVNADQIEMVSWQRLAGTWGIRIFTREGNLQRFAGFKDAVSGRARNICMHGGKWHSFVIFHFLCFVNLFSSFHFIFYLFSRSAIVLPSFLSRTIHSTCWTAS
jgi:hypothetical protein